MKTLKIIAVTVLVLMAFAMLFGCTGNGNVPGTDTNAPKVTTSAEANKTLNDASTDLSTIKQTLDDIENTLSK
jgi:hypothetical protein